MKSLRISCQLFLYHTTARRALEQLSIAIAAPVVVECKPLESFYPAEEYHQNYLEKNPGGYCHISPAMFAAAKAWKRDV